MPKECLAKRWTNVIRLMQHMGRLYTIATNGRKCMKREFSDIIPARMIKAS